MGFRKAQLGQRFMAVNIAVVDRISAISQEREKRKGDSICLTKQCKYLSIRN